MGVLIIYAKGGSFLAEGGVREPHRGDTVREELQNNNDELLVTSRGEVQQPRLALIG